MRKDQRSQLFMSLPPLDRLCLTPTGEFYPLRTDQVDDLNREGAEEPLTRQQFQLDSDGPEDAWHTFRVELNPLLGPSKDQFYHAESLWMWYQKNAGLADPPTDPLTRQSAWYEDWWELHERFDPQGTVPVWAHTLPKLKVAKEIVAEERWEREEEIEEHKLRIKDGEEMWMQLIQYGDPSLATMLSRNRRLTYHEHYIYIHLVRLAAIAPSAYEGARILREANEWERKSLTSGEIRQAWLRSKRGESPNGIEDRVDAREAANAQLERINLKEKEFFKSEIFHRRH